MRIVLHIGTEKTGTTTLQDFVYAHQDTLRRRGVALSELLGKTNNRKLVSYCMPPALFDDYFRDRRIRTQAERAAHFDGFREDFVAEARTCAQWAHTLLITSEHFHSRLRDPASIGRLKSVLDEIGGEVLVLCWFREQGSVMRSLYSTAVKSGTTEPIDHFARRCKPDNDYYQYHRLMTRWAGVFGAAALRPRLFDRRHLVGGDIRRDLLAQLLPADDDLAGFDFSAPPANPSLGAAGLELGRVINRVCPRYLPDGTLDPVRQALMQQLMHSELGRLGQRPVPQAQAIHEAFAPSNTLFASEFLGQPGNPFPPAAGGAADTTVEVPLDTLRRFYEDLLLAVRDPETRARLAAAPAPPGYAGRRLADVLRRGWRRLRRQDPGEAA